MLKSAVMKAVALAAVITYNTNAKAQKKSDVHENNPAPATVRVDGKLMEWPEQSFTLHSETKLQYVVSNDNKNLYLTIKTDDQEKISKIIARGITLSVNKEGRKKEGGSITFPVIRPQRTQSTSKNSSQALQHRLAEAKEIDVRGLETIIDGGIAITNEYGIQVAAALDSMNHFSYELAVPLHHIGLSVHEGHPFAVNIRINGISLPKMQTRPRSPYESMRMGGYNRAAIPPFYKTEEFWILRTLKRQ